jgi:hypothetical protein
MNTIPVAKLMVMLSHNVKTLVGHLTPMQEALSLQKLQVRKKEKEIMVLLSSLLVKRIPKEEETLFTLLTSRLEPTKEKGIDPLSVLEELVMASIDFDRMESKGEVDLCWSPLRFVGNSTADTMQPLVDDLNRCEKFFTDIALFKVRIQSGNQLCFCFQWKAMTEEPVPA